MRCLWKWLALLLLVQHSAQYSVAWKFLTLCNRSSCECLQCCCFQIVTNASQNAAEVMRALDQQNLGDYSAGECEFEQRMCVLQDPLYCIGDHVETEFYIDHLCMH